MTLRAVEPVPSHPSWDEVWTADDLATYLQVNTATIYAGCARGDWDFALAPTGRAKRFLGPSLAARWNVPGYASGGRGDQSRD